LVHFLPAGTENFIEETQLYVKQNHYLIRKHITYRNFKCCHSTGCTKKV